MCMEDVRLGRETGYATVVASAAAATPAVIIGPDPQRVALMISVQGAVNALVGPKNLDMSGGAGIVLSQTMLPLKLTLTDQGRVVTDSWSASGIGGTATVIVVATYLEKK